MDSKARSTRIWSACSLATAAVYFGVHLWFLLAALIDLRGSDRSSYWDLSRESIECWALFSTLGVLLAAFAFRFDRLSGGGKNVFLGVCVVTAIAVGSVAEWWTSMYFAFPALFLVASRRRAIHA